MTAKPRQQKFTRQKITWAKTFRIVRAEGSPVSLIDDIAQTGDWGFLESSVKKTRSYGAAQTRNLMAIPKERRIPIKPGAEVVLAPFIECSRARPSRFTDGSYGVWYAAKKEETALHERLYHYRKFIESSDATKNTRSSSEFKTLLSPVNCRLHNVNKVPGVLDADDYEPAQKLGASLRDANSNGVVWNSVRHPAGKCIGLFWPDVVGSPVKDGAQFTFQWRGNGEIVIKNHETGKVFEVK